MEFLFYIILGWFVGKWFGEYLIVKKIAAHMEANDIKKNKIDVPLLVLEKHKDILYLFEKDTDTFVCQGNTMKELATALATYKKINIAVVEYESNILWFINGEVKDRTVSE